jgi:hypothetical protein
VVLPVPENDFALRESALDGGFTARQRSYTDRHFHERPLREQLRAPREGRRHLTVSSPFPELSDCSLPVCGLGREAIPPNELEHPGVRAKDSSIESSQRFDRFLHLAFRDRSAVSSDQGFRKASIPGQPISREHERNHQLPLILSPCHARGEGRSENRRGFVSRVGKDVEVFHRLCESGPHRMQSCGLSLRPGDQGVDDFTAGSETGELIPCQNCSRILPVRTASRESGVR